jgi:putative transposase
MATKKINLSLENLVVLEKIWVLNSLIDNQEPLELCSKAMWDTTFTNSVGDVILDIHDISDVGECIG